MKQIKNDDNFVRAPADGVVGTASSKTDAAPGKSNIQAENAQRKIDSTARRSSSAREKSN